MFQINIYVYKYLYTYIGIGVMSIIGHFINGSYLPCRLNQDISCVMLLSHVLAVWNS